MAFKKAIVLGVAALVSALSPAGVTTAMGANLVKNGDFELTTNGNNLQLKGGFTQLQDWDVDGGLSFVVGQGWTSAPVSGHPNDTGAWGEYGQFNVWSPAKNAANGFTDSPLGGNYIVADGAVSYHGAISQMINGLVVGKEYEVTFAWATGQQWGFDGETWEKGWDVSFGGEPLKTVRKVDVDHGFSGWFQETMSFTATSASQLLSFLAQGQPNGEPPLVMLDGVSVSQAVPEPSTMLMMGLGFAGLAGFGLRRRAGR